MLDFLNNKFIWALGRILLVLVYVITGSGLLSGNVPVEYAATKGVPALLVWIGFSIKVFGGLAVIVGFQTRLAAMLLIAFTLGTAFIFHPFWMDGQMGMFLKEMSMIGGLLVIAAVGPGELSIDGKK